MIGIRAVYSFAENERSVNHFFVIINIAGACADSDGFPSSGGKTLSAARVMARFGNRAITGGFSDSGSPCLCAIFGKVAESTGARTCQLSQADTTWQMIPENLWRTGGLAE